MADGATTVLLVGATGFIGQHLQQHLLGQGHRVLGTSSDGSGAELACDIESQASVDAAIASAAPDAIVLSAGQAAVAESWRDPVFTLRSNTSGAFHLLDGMRRHAPTAHLCFLSSAAVYGAPSGVAGQPFTENSAMQPSSPYGASKAAAELLCRQHARGFGLRIAIARLFNQIGPGQPASQAPSEFASALASAEAAGEPVLELGIGNPDFQRDFTDVRDTARALARLSELELTGTFNLCRGSERSLGEIAQGLASFSQVDIKVAPDEAHERPQNIGSLPGSPEKLKRATGWQPEISFERSLEDLLKDWRSGR